MSSVDKRIVEMEFDNKEFEKGVSTTINSIDDLKKSLDFKGVEKGFDKITAGFEGIKLGGVSDAVESITSKFSILGTVGDQALRTITNTITSKVLVAFKEFSGMITGTQYAMDGFSEYELKMKSIQTIAANTGALSTNNMRELTEAEEQAAQDVIKGVYGVGEYRKQKLEELGYEYDVVQNRVNQLVSNIQNDGKKTVTTMKDINASLDDLNTYADKTIYNFAQMTDAIGKFTVAGIDLDQSTEMVKGIANLAALSGADNAAYQKTLYNLSQSMSTGSLQTIDWRSLEWAGMGGEILQKAIIESGKKSGDAAAVAMANAIEKGDIAFRDSLKEHWVTNDILTQALNKFTAFTEDMTDAEIEAEKVKWRNLGYTEKEIEDIQELSKLSYEAATKVRTYTQLMSTLKEEIGSSYTSMWQNIFGDFNEATELWTGIHTVIEDNFIKPMTTARDIKWSYFHDNGGRDAAIKGFANVGNSMLAIMNAIRDAWHAVFPPDDGKRITAIAKAFASFSEKLVIGDDTAEKIKITFQGLFSILHIGVTIIKTVLTVIGKLISGLASLGGTSHPILDLTSAIGKLLIKFDDFITDSDRIAEVIDVIIELFKKIPPVIKPVSDAIGNFFTNNLGPKVKGVFTDLSDYVKGFKKDTEDTVNSMGESDTSGVEKFSDKVKNKLSPVGETITKVFGKLGDIAGKVWDWIKGAFGRLKDLLAETDGKDISLSAVIEALLGAELFMMLHNLSGLFNGAKDTLKNVDKMLDNVNNILKGVKDVLQAYVMDIKANAILKIAGAVLMLCAGLIALSMIDAKALWMAVGAMTALFIELGALVKVLSGGADSLMKGAFVDMGGVLLKMSVGILIMAQALKSLSDMDSKQLGMGVASLTLLLAEIAGFVKIVNIGDGNLAKVSGVILAVATAVNVLVPAVLLLGALKDIADKGIAGLFLILGELTVALSWLAVVTNKFEPKSIAAVGFAIVEISAAIDLLLPAIIALALLPTDKMIKAIGGLSAMILVFTVGISAMAQAMDNTSAPRILAVGAAIGEIAIALNLLLIPILLLSLIPFPLMLQGLIITWAMIGTLVGVLISIPKDSASRASSFATMAASILVIAGSLVILGELDTKSILISTIALAAIVLAMVAAFKSFDNLKNTTKIAALMQSMAIGIIAMTAAIYVLSKINSTKLLVVVAALFGLLGIFTIFGAAVDTFPGIATGLMDLSKAITVFGAGITLVGGGLYLFAEGMKTLSKLDFSEANYAGLTEAISDLLDAIIANGPKAVEAVLTLVSSIISGLIMRVPYFVTTLLGIIGDILIALGKNIGKIANGVIDIIVKVFDAVGGRAYELVTSFVDMFTSLIDALAANAYDIIEAGANFVLSVIEGIVLWLADDENRHRLQDDIGELISMFYFTIAEFAVDMFKAGWDLMKSMGKGIASGASMLFSAIKEAISNAINWIKNTATAVWDGIKEIGENIINGIVEGFKSAKSKLGKGLSKIVNFVVDKFEDGFDTHSPSKVTERIGEFVAEGLAVGMDNGTKDVSKSADNLTNTILDSVNGVNDNIEQPTVTPVMDLSDFNYDQDQLDNMSATMSKDLKTKFDFSPTTTSSLAFNMPEINTDSNLVAEAVDKLKGEMSDIKEFIANLNIRMDSGALVGSIVNKMDKELGNLSTLKGRFM